MNRLKELVLFSKPLSVLYVEDDLGIRDNYAKVFGELFFSVDLAADGQEGLEMYQSNSYDVLITDINMPRMNGIEMLEEVIKINPDQAIIVTSAHDDAHYLLKLIDLGIEKFLIKPVDFSKLTTVLYRTCKRITEIAELKEYQARIEEENLRSAELLKELQLKNDELEKTIHKLTRKENVNITLVDGIEKEKAFSSNELEYYSPKPDTISAKVFIESFAGNLETLNDHLEGIEDTLELLIHQKLLQPTQESLQALSSAFEAYANHLFNLYKFNHIAEALHNFARTLSQVEDLELLKEMKEFLFGIADSLQKWRQEILVLQSAEDIHFLDNSIISDCLQTESMLSHSSHASTDDLDDLFF